MTDREVEAYLDKIATNVEILQKRGAKKYTSLFNGVLSGFGSVIGAALAIAIIGWLLNIVGIIPAFRNEAAKWEKILQTGQSVKVPASQSTK
jgi:hypothetical protein